MTLSQLNAIYIEPCVRVTLEQMARDKTHWSSFVRDRLSNHGAVLLRDVDLRAPPEFEDLVNILSYENSWFTYQQRATPRTALGGNVFTSTEYPAHLSIFAHNECANQTSWPARLYFYCNRAADTGGATPLTDIRAVTARIPEELRRDFREKGVQYMRSIGGALGVSLEYAFGTSARSDIDRYCTEERISVRWRSENSLEMQFNRPSFRYHPITGDELWFNHLMFYSLVSLEPRLRDNLRRMPAARRAYHARFGDATEVAESDLELLRQIYDDTTIRFTWRKGDLLVVDNMFWAHGRDPYEGSRELWVALAEPIAEGIEK